MNKIHEQWQLKYYWSLRSIIERVAYKFKLPYSKEKKKKKKTPHKGTEERERWGEGIPYRRWIYNTDLVRGNSKRRVFFFVIHVGTQEITMQRPWNSPIVINVLLYMIFTNLFAIFHTHGDNKNTCGQVARSTQQLALALALAGMEIMK